MARNIYAEIAAKDADAVSREKLKISFEFVDWDSEDIFFIHGIEPTYYHKLFECVTTIKNSLEKQITEQSHPSLRPKSIFNTDTSVRDSFPDSVVDRLVQKLKVESVTDEEAKDKAIEYSRRAFEVSPSKSYGRVHGFVWNNTFHVVWFDPAHNLYPWSGKGKKPRPPTTIRCFSPEEALKLREEIDALKKENSELWEALDEYMRQ